MRDNVSYVNSLVGPAGRYGSLVETAETIQMEQRQRLLDGLAEAIREKGFGETQIADIVRFAKASRRTFYNHFPDKESAYVELLDVLTTGIIEQLDSSTDRSAPV